MPYSGLSMAKPWPRRQAALRTIKDMRKNDIYIFVPINLWPQSCFSSYSCPG